LLLLIIGDLVFGIAAGIRTETFSWKKIGEWFSTNVIRYGFGYFLVWALMDIVPKESQDALGLGDLGAMFGAGVAFVALISSISSNVQKVAKPSSDA
jgi:hypothetical protein